MNSKNHNQRRNQRFQRSGLIFYCYLLIPLNELAQNVLKINKLKIQKKIIDISGISIGNGQKGRFWKNYELRITFDTPIASRLSGQALFLPHAALGLTVAQRGIRSLRHQSSETFINIVQTGTAK